MSHVSAMVSNITESALRNAGGQPCLAYVSVADYDLLSAAGMLRLNSTGIDVTVHPRDEQPFGAFSISVPLDG